MSLVLAPSSDFILCPHRGDSKRMANERVTENLVRDQLRKLGYYSPGAVTCVDEQRSEIVAIQRLLRSASKTKRGGPGSPEFIITSPDDPDFVIVIECKADAKRHKSASLSAPVTHAVDGALHYAEALSKEYNVIAIGVSGEAKHLLIDSYIWAKGSPTHNRLTNRGKAPITEILSWADFITNATFDPKLQALRFDELMAFSRELHVFMRDHMKLIESEKPLVVSGTLIALRDEGFATGFKSRKPEDLQKHWLRAIQDQIESADIPNASKRTAMVQPYESIANHPELGKPSGKTAKKYPGGVLKELVSQLHEKVWPFIFYYHDFDVVGRFYGEFLKYTGGDKKALGIVLTPRHVTELFARLAFVDKDSRVLDICAGTAGFLISAMHQMMQNASTEAERQAIKAHGLYGVEQQPNMYALAASNMILRGDGKANLYQGSCFDPAIVSAIKESQCDVGVLNPPYSQGDEDLHELYFVSQMLNCLTKGGVGIAIVPISCAIAPHPAKRELLKHHTLRAVMSMPQELFYPVGVVTCIMVFTAHMPHGKGNRKTWFGFWRDDGFVKTKHRGRIDLNGTWPATRDRWIAAFQGETEEVGFSVRRKVEWDDEWCAEAYLETDYSALNRRQFENEIRKYISFRVMNELPEEAET
jgi:type I restriction enzyme M protein